MSKITQEQVDEILANSEISVSTVFDKCTVTAVKLPNGFIIVESAACIDPHNYDEQYGYILCMEKVSEKIWELEGYKSHEYKPQQLELPFTDIEEQPVIQEENKITYFGD